MAVALFEDSIFGAVAKVALVILGIGAVASGALASMALYQVREGSLLGRWMNSRAQAEIRRLGVFSTVVQMEDPGEVSDVQLDLLKLEYVRRYQLDVQIVYFRRRGREHLRSAEQTLEYGGIAAGIGGIVSGAAGLTAAFQSSSAAIAALGVAGTAFAAFATAREEVNQDRRNAERYERTLLALEDLQSRLDDVRAAVAGGSREALNEFVAALHDVLSAEHREWLKGADRVGSAIERLDTTLKALREAEADQGQTS